MIAGGMLCCDLLVVSGQDFGLLCRHDYPAVVEWLHYLYVHFGGIPRELLEIYYLNAPPDDSVLAIHQHDSEVRQAIKVI
jgi:hypothetical protein